MQVIFVIYYQQLVDSGMVGEELISNHDGILLQFLLLDYVHVFAGDCRIGHPAVGVAGLHHAA